MLNRRIATKARAVPAPAYRVPVLALLLLAGLIAFALSAPAHSRSQNVGAESTCERCWADCKSQTGGERRQCESRCEKVCNISAHPAGTFESAPAAAEAQVCCRTGRAFKFTYSWMSRDLCKPPDRKIMETPVKCPMQRSQ